MNFKEITKENVEEIKLQYIRFFYFSKFKMINKTILEDNERRIEKIIKYVFSENKANKKIEYIKENNLINYNSFEASNTNSQFYQLFKQYEKIGLITFNRKSYLSNLLGNDYIKSNKDLLFKWFILALFKWNKNCLFTTAYNNVVSQQLDLLAANELGIPHNILQLVLKVRRNTNDFDFKTTLENGSIFNKGETKILSKEDRKLQILELCRNLGSTVSLENLENNRGSL